MPTLASCSFDKHGLILIILGKQHRHSFKNYMRIRLSLSLHFCLLYLLFNSCDGNDAKQRVFLGRLLVALKRVGPLKRAGFILADVQSDVLSPSFTLALHVTAFSIDQQLCRGHFQMCFSMCHASSSSSSRMRVMNHNWSATKQHLHPQSVAEISCHSVLSGDRIRQCGTSSGSCHKDTDQCL